MAWLAGVALRSLVLAGVAGAGLAALRARRGATRLQIWTLVLYAALAMPALCLVLPRLPVPLPILPPRPVAAPAQLRFSQPSHDVANTPAGSAGAPSAGTLFAASAPPIGASKPWRFDWASLVAGVYIGGVLVLLGRLGAGVALAKQLARTARPVAELGPDVLESDAVAVPAAIGVRRAHVMLPPAWRGWERWKLEAVLTHERAHIARGDGLTQRLALLHQALFWFSPLGWWLPGQLAALAEESRDEEVLRAGMEPGVYAGVLLEFLEQLQQGSRRVRWHEVAMARAGNVVRRLERVLEWKKEDAMSVNRGLLLKMTLAAIPLVALIGAAQPRLMRHRDAATRTALAPARASDSIAAAAPTRLAAQQTPLANSGVMQGYCLSCPAPVYPPEAREAGVTGAITLTGTIGTDGALKNLEWESGDPRLVAAAVAAVQQWRYSPEMLDSRPQETQATITVVFHLAGLPARPTASGYGTISGRVVDATGAAVPGANVSVSGGNGVQSAETGPDGGYSFAGLAAGSYTLSVGKRGFAVARGDASVTAGTAALMDFMLRLGSATQTVEVTAQGGATP